MTKKPLAHFEKRLLEERKRVVKELGNYGEAFGATLQSADGNLSSYSFHMADQGTDAMEREKAFLFASSGGTLPLAHRRGAAPAVPRRRRRSATATAAARRSTSIDSMRCRTRVSASRASSAKKMQRSRSASRPPSGR